MIKIRENLDKILMSICVTLFMFMTVVGTYQITSRYVFKSPSTVSEELISYSFAWTAMLAAAYIFGKRDHMRMGFFVERFSKTNQIYVSILAEIAVFLFAVGVLLKGGISITILTMTQTTPALRISMGYVYSIIPICGVIICIYSVLNAGDLFKKLKGEM
ncbi:TRAP transporter small permease [uncultured Cetobacterium sp.]|uniref:TRAP transporter small permease n=1 Tax=uncultured Cetobacterium sp. TaxID=527638 RepID=UPI0026230AAB|nr:TRAP transporter small permease [uncultured Cetobacterium sp.]